MPGVCKNCDFQPVSCFILEVVTMETVAMETKSCVSETHCMCVQQIFTHQQSQTVLNSVLIGYGFA